MLVVVITKRKPKKISCSSFACWELSRVNSFISFLFFGGREEKTMIKMLKWLLYALLLNYPRAHIALSSPVYWMLADSSLVQCTCTIIIIHTVRSCKWKAIMTIYDEWLRWGKAGMNSTYLVFVNMISSSFLIQPIMNETCLQWQLEIIVAYAMLN